MPQEPPKKEVEQTDQSPEKQTVRDDKSGETSQADNVQIHGTAKNMPNEPPNKKLKLTDLQSPVEQQTARDDKSGETSHNAQKKQTARDSESGETSQASANVQKTTAHSFKKEVEEGHSKDLQLEAEEKKHEFRFRLNSKTYSVSGKTSMTVLEALNTSNIFRFEKDKKKNKQKEILILRSNRAAVKTDFPCCLIEEDEILDITFIQKDGNSSTNQQTTADPSLLSKRGKPETLVTFLVEKEGGPTVTCLLKSKALRKKVRYVCVFAFKGEKIKTALKRDGRFNNVIFGGKKKCGLHGLESDTETTHEFSKTVTKTLNKKIFQVVVISDNNQPESQDDATFVKTEPNEASDADAAENVGPSQNPINTEQEKQQDGNTTKSTNLSTKRYVVKPIDKSEDILKILRDQFKDLLETLKQRKNMNKTQVQKLFREEYHKSVENFSEVKKVKNLMRLSDSVCQIRDAGSAIGTGFLLFNKFILTNAHVIGISADCNRKTVNVEQVTAVFDYEDLDSQIKRIPVKQLAAGFYGKDPSGRHLDYALLELDCDDFEMANFPKLFSCYSPTVHPPNRGQICIVGHPGAGVKKMDPCIIIERENRPEAADKHVSENENLFNVMTQKSLEEKWDFFDNEITYDSCFFHGSSGSPVFDVDCNLIGIHTGGYEYERKKHKTWSVMEYGFTMQPILENIKARAKIKGLDDIINILKPFSDKSYVSGAADQQNQTDYEMDSAEEA